MPTVLRDGFDVSSEVLAQAGAVDRQYAQRHEPGAPSVSPVTSVAMTAPFGRTMTAATGGRFFSIQNPLAHGILPAAGRWLPVSRCASVIFSMWGSWCPSLPVSFRPCPDDELRQRRRIGERAHVGCPCQDGEAPLRQTAGQGRHGVWSGHLV